MGDPQHAPAARADNQVLEAAAPVVGEALSHRRGPDRHAQTPVGRNREQNTVGPAMADAHIEPARPRVTASGL
eukprot:11196528-Lingulodinium_polyedra.AAC.1